MVYMFDGNWTIVGGFNDYMLNVVGFVKLVFMVG